MAKKTGTVKKKVVKVGAVGMAYVHSTFNNGRRDQLVVGR